ncbi:heterogeneous nuclear ribonucleoprotein 1 [Elaeis guineensis]|uniref:Heterogeneous nuclear ribonucleoprotein 1 n=1 Tax=Elaeis guineensis var. tenera TaxID=51953 RepID=A0A6I9SF07_ELAGV|nr:heterogeneous nuclear ribonucleoprotein 1 [Elaeis guineensis]XP_010941957.1 heterogeneous nuclear ribonucleoprotein 1 [Elaeis guineensis]XP_029116299.1 heterogeneous nuclear ribonucleoprotein 1 [Elaeis guineensis]
MGEVEPSSSSAPSMSSPVSEQGKLFVGGISSETREEVLVDHFKKYGEVKEVVVMRDRITGNCRGFGFVKFLDPQVAERVLQEKKKHVILGRTVEVKKAMPRAKQNQSHQALHHQYANQSPYRSRGLNRSSTNNDSSNRNHSKSKKIFVGGLSDNITEDDFKNYFQNFGTITDVVVMYDSATHRPRGFGFITFDSEEAVENVMQKSFHELNGKLVEVKIAVPKDGNNHSNNSNRNNNNYNSQMMGARGPAFSNHPAGIYSPHTPRYGFFHGYAPPPWYAYGGGYYGGYAVGSYGGIGYGVPSPGPRGFWNVQELVPSGRGLVPNTATYPVYANRGFGGSFRGVAAFDNGMEYQTSSDVQTPAVASTAPSQVESVKLEAQ